MQDDGTETDPCDSDRTQTEAVFYDAHCPLCRAAVRLIHSAAGERERFRCLPLASDAAAALMSSAERAALPDSLVVRADDGRLLVRSAAMTHVLSRLGGGWSLLAALIRLLPVWLRDWCYDFVARRRTRDAYRQPPGPTDPGA